MYTVQDVSREVNVLVSYIRFRLVLVRKLSVLNFQMTLMFLFLKGGLCNSLPMGNAMTYSVNLRVFELVIG